MCVCVCVREREIDRGLYCMVCMWHTCVCLHVCFLVGGGSGGGVFMLVCVSAFVCKKGERWRERYAA